MENLISLTSTFVPLLGSCLYTVFPTCFWEAASCAIIGSIQIICGVQLVRNNTRGLIGFRIDDKTLDKLSTTIKNSPYLDKVSQERGTYTSEMEYKLEAKTTYNLEKLTSDVVESSKEAIERLMYAKTPESRYYYIMQIMENTPKIIFKQIQKHEVNLEELLRKENPNIADIDIDIEHQDLLLWDELDRVKIVEELNFSGVDEYAKNWMDSATAGILGNNYIRQVQTKGLKKIAEEQTLSDSSFYLGKSDPYHYYESFDIYEDIRFEILQKSAEERRRRREI